MAESKPECGVRIGNRRQTADNRFTYPCSLDEGHEGPHYAGEVARSSRDRAQWMEQTGQRISTSAKSDEPILVHSSEGQNLHEQLVNNAGRVDTSKMERLSLQPIQAWQQGGSRAATSEDLQEAENRAEAIRADLTRQEEAHQFEDVEDLRDDEEGWVSNDNENARLGALEDRFGAVEEALRALIAHLTSGNPASE